MRYIELTSAALICTFKATGLKEKRQEQFLSVCSLLLCVILWEDEESPPNFFSKFFYFSAKYFYKG